MERIRDSVNGIAVKIILGLIILSFLFASVGGYISAGNVEPVVFVGDREISQEQFEQAYQNERQQLQAQAGDMVASLLSDPNYLQQFRRNVLDRMVNQSLLDQYVDELSLRISDEQLKEAIRDIPAFSSNGIFNNEVYLETLRRSGLTTDQFAEYIRQDLARQDLVDAFEATEFTLDNELVALYKLEKQTRSARTITLPLSHFSEQITITDEQKKAYYEKNSARFLRPEQFSISYVELSGETMAKDAQVSLDDAKAYYQANLASYGSAEQRKVSHIMLDGDDAEQQANVILEQLKSGADFAQLAKSNSKDTFSAENGGQLDWFDKGVMDPAFELAAFALNEKGSLSEVVQSDFGYHIIKLDDIKPSNAKPFDEVSDEIIAKLKQQQAVDKFYEQSNLLAEKAFEVSDNLDEAAKSINGRVEQTDFVSLDKLTGVLDNPQVIQAIEQNDVRDNGLNSDIITISPEHVIVLRVNEVRPEIILPFEQVEPQIEQILVRQEEEKAAQTLADELLTALNEGNNDFVKDSGYAFGKEEMFTRSSPNEITNLLFSMAKPAAGKTAYGITKALNGDPIIVALDAVKEPDVNINELPASFSEKTVRTAINTDMSSLLDHLRETIEVVYTPEKQNQ